MNYSTKKPAGGFRFPCEASLSGDIEVILFHWSYGGKSVSKVLCYISATAKFSTVIFCFKTDRDDTEDLETVLKVCR